MKVVQQPGNTSEVEASVIGAPRQIRVDVAKGTIRVHDGVTQGGHELVNVDMMKQAIQTGGETGGTAAAVRYFSSESELQDFVPTPTTIAIVNQDGVEDIYAWKAAANDGGGLNSNVDGSWHRLDSRTGMYVRLQRAGAINMQFGGAAPGVNQDITAWLDNGVAKLWDGAAYQIATPVLFARLLSKIGNYAGTIVLPDQIAELLVVNANLNTETKSGWKKSSAADVNAPSATVSPVFTYVFDANNAYQQFFVQGSTTGAYYVRSKVATVWGSWILIDGATPSRLAATPGAVTDANTAIDSGWYTALSTATNIPVAENGVLQVIRRSSTDTTQMWRSVAADKIYARRMLANVWQAWVAIYPADVTVATGTLPRANVGILTISQAEAEAGTATTDRIFTAERVKQAIQIWWAAAADYLSNTANKVLTAAAVWAAAVPVNLGAALSGNLTLNYSTAINFYGTATGNITWNASSNVKAGQSGVIEITASGGDRTVSVTTSAFTFIGNLPTITSGTKCTFGYFGLQGGKTLLWVLGKGLTP